MPTSTTREPAGYPARPAGYAGWRAGHLGDGLPAASSRAWPRLGEFWLTLGAFLGLFRVQFSIQKKWELKYDIP